MDGRVFAQRAITFAGPWPIRSAAEWYDIAWGRAHDGELELTHEEMRDFLAFAYLNMPYVNMPYEVWPMRLCGHRVVYRRG
jgi:hypothetical protein